MKTLIGIAATLTMSIGLTSPAFATSPDCYVVNFRNTKDINSARLDSVLSTALAISGVNAEEVVIDTTTTAKWEKGANEAFDRDIVPVFNRWVGLPGFAAVVGAKSKRVIGCVNSTFSASEIADKIRQMCSMASGGAFLSRASYHLGLAPRQNYIIKTSLNTKTTKCPAAHNSEN